MKSLPATQKTRVQSLGSDDLLEEEMAAHSSILAGIIPWTEEPGGLGGVAKVGGLHGVTKALDTTEHTCV